jgi:iron complex outermembrane receptor protein
MMNKFYFYFLSATVVNPVQLCAAEDNAADSFFLDDAPAVLTATRLKQPLADAPAAITVIDKTMIKASGAKEIAEIFRLVPGMQVAAKRGYLPSTTYHGMSDEFSQGMQILIDGHSVYNTSFGGLFWGDFPLLIEDIEHIEVIRGPAAATYGPNAFLGVINIITTHTSQDQGGQANVRAGGGDYFRGAIRYGGQWKDLGYRFSYAHNEDDGLEGVLDNQDANMLNMRLDYQLSNQDMLQYNLGISHSEHRLGVKNSLSDPSRTTKNNQYTQLLRWEHQFDPTEQLTIQLTHNRHEVDSDFFSDGESIANDQLSERFDFELQHILSPFQNTRVVWGLGARLDRARLPLWVGSDDKSNVLYHIFANIEWKFLDDFSLNLGALLEKNSYTHVDISPKIALNYLWSDQQSFRLMASRASRMPTIGEQNLSIDKPISTIIDARGKTKKTLKPVEVTTFEAGHHGEFFDQKLVTDIKISHQRFHRLTQITGIDFDSKGVFLEFGTDGVATAINYEIQVDYKPDQQSLVHLGYSWVNLNHEGGFLNYRESVPHHTLNLLAAYQFPYQWEASLGYYYRSEMQYLRSDRVGQFQRLDFILRKSFTLSESQKIELSFIHQNNLGSKDGFEQDHRLSDRTFFEIAYQFD